MIYQSICICCEYLFGVGQGDDGRLWTEPRHHARTLAGSRQRHNGRRIDAIGNGRGRRTDRLLDVRIVDLPVQLGRGLP